MEAPEGGTKAVRLMEPTVEVFTTAKQALFDAKCLASPSLEPHFGRQWMPLPPTRVFAFNRRCQACLHGNPLGFFSKQLEPEQEKYSIFDRDLYACYMGIRHFHFMLKGRRFTI
jgi:hypothetical protein